MQLYEGGQLYLRFVFGVFQGAKYFEIFILFSGNFFKDCLLERLDRNCNRPLEVTGSSYPGITLEVF